MQRKLHLVGPIPSWLDPETAGWRFREASVVFGSQIHRLFIETESGLRHPDDEPRVYFPDDPAPNPNVHMVWWERDDRFTPSLLAGLLEGYLVAFGDPNRAGAIPEWIAPRQWVDLQPDPDHSTLFRGGGTAYWNVRVMPLREFQERAALELEKDASESAAPPGPDLSADVTLPPDAQPSSSGRGRKRGPKGGLTDQIADKILVDLQAGTVSEDDLVSGGKQEDWAQRYGARSRDTLVKALNRARKRRAEALAANHDKQRQIPAIDK